MGVRSIKLVRLSVAFAVSLGFGTARADITGSSSAPVYTTDGLVNAATQAAGPVSPNCLVTIYGTNLAYTTRAAGPADLLGGALPLSLDGVTVSVGNFAAGVLFVSPGQINFVIPYNLTAGTVNFWVVRQGVAGPVLKIDLTSTAPGLFPWNGNFAIATHLNGSLVSATSPSSAGEIIVIYAAGLGRVTPDTSSGKIAPSAAIIAALPQFQVLLAGTACPAANVLYAGLAPGFSGLYQINLRLPAKLPANPEIRLAIGTLMSPAKIVLAVQ